MNWLILIGNDHFQTIENEELARNARRYCQNYTRILTLSSKAQTLLQACGLNLQVDSQVLSQLKCMDTDHLVAYITWITYITWINHNYAFFSSWQTRKQQALLELSDRTQVIVF